MNRHKDLHLQLEMAQQSRDAVKRIIDSWRAENLAMVERIAASIAAQEDDL